MSDILFYIVKRLTTCEPFIDEFLFGQYDRGEEHFKIYQEIEEGETVRYSKNVSRFPKILGVSELALPTDLALCPGRDRSNQRERQVGEKLFLPPFDPTPFFISSYRASSRPLRLNFLSLCHQLKRFLNQLSIDRFLGLSKPIRAAVFSAHPQGNGRSQTLSEFSSREPARCLEV